MTSADIWPGAPNKPPVSTLTHFPWELVPTLYPDHGTFSQNKVSLLWSCWVWGGERRYLSHIPNTLTDSISLWPSVSPPFTKRWYDQSLSLTQKGVWYMAFQLLNSKEEKWNYSRQAAGSGKFPNMKEINAIGISPIPISPPLHLPVSLLWSQTTTSSFISLTKLWASRELYSSL